VNYVLSVDTASSQLSVCLKKNSSWFEMNIQDGLKHSETLMNTILVLLKEANVSKEELELIICSEGPGSFTGLRIGMSTVKGMAFGLGIPYTSIPTTDYYASGFDYFPGAVVPVLDAKKKRFYCAVYHEGKRIMDPSDLSMEDLLESVKNFNKVLISGPDCMMIPEEARAGIVRDLNFFQGKSRQLLELGLSRFLKEGSMPENSGPVYLRKSEAEIAFYGEK